MTVLIVEYEIAGAAVSHGEDLVQHHGVASECELIIIGWWLTEALMLQQEEGARTSK